MYYVRRILRDARRIKFWATASLFFSSFAFYLQTSLKNALPRSKLLSVRSLCFMAMASLRAGSFRFLILNFAVASLASLKKRIKRLRLRYAPENMKGLFLQKV